MERSGTPQPEFFALQYAALRRIEEQKMRKK
jgi:hypothetical protein